MEYAIELRHITKTFGSVIANNDVSLDVRKGEILSLLGENGSGKTTLMNMIAGIYYPDSGEILVEGKPVEIRSPKDAYAHGIGMVHQHFKLVDVLTAKENIIAGTDDSGFFTSGKAMAAKIRAVEEKFGLKLDPDKKRVYFVSVRDGEREANFITDGSDHLTAENFVSGMNANGHRFFGHKQDLREVYAQDIRKNAKIFKTERADMVGFILDCLEIPAIFATEGSKVYTA